MSVTAARIGISTTMTANGRHNKDIGWSVGVVYVSDSLCANWIAIHFRASMGSPRSQSASQLIQPAQTAQPVQNEASQFSQPSQPSRCSQLSQAGSRVRQFRQLSSAQAVPASPSSPSLVPASLVSATANCRHNKETGCSVSGCVCF